MSTATITNESPLVADLEFDLGDVIACQAFPQDECQREVVWLYSFPCGCYNDIPCCKHHRIELRDFMSRGLAKLCKRCDGLLIWEHLIWRRL